MKAVLAVCFLFAAVALARPEEKPEDKQYTSRYDNIDLDEVIHNDKVLENYMNCCLDKGRCTPDGKELKSHIKEALETNCKKCTDVQRKGVNKVLSHIINHIPDYWADLTAKFDPTGKFTAQYEKELRELKKP